MYPVETRFTWNGWKPWPWHSSINSEIILGLVILEPMISIAEYRELLENNFISRTLIWSHRMFQEASLQRMISAKQFSVNSFLIEKLYMNEDWRIALDFWEIDRLWFRKWCSCWNSKQWSYLEGRLRRALQPVSVSTRETRGRTDMCSEQFSDSQTRTEYHIPRQSATHSQRSAQVQMKDISQLVPNQMKALLPAQSSWSFQFPPVHSATFSCLGLQDLQVVPVSTTVFCYCHFLDEIRDGELVPCKPVLFLVCQHLLKWQLFGGNPWFCFQVLRRSECKEGERHGGECHGVLETKLELTEAEFWVVKSPLSLLANH